MRQLQVTKQFKKDYKRSKERGYNLEELERVINMLLEEDELPSEYRDHALVGKYLGHRECHIRPDWLLIYSYTGDRLILIANRTGSHSDLFR